MLLQQNPLLLAAFGMDVEAIKQEIEKAKALEKLKVCWFYILSTKIQLILYIGSY